MKKKSCLDIVKEYLEGWESKDLSKIKLCDNFRHSSQGETYESSDDFLKECWQYSGIEMSEKEFVSSVDTVCARYKIRDKHGNDIRVCEWIKVEDEKSGAWMCIFFDVVKLWDHDFNWFDRDSIIA